MCGIAGVYFLGKAGTKSELSSVNAMCDLMVHRGPDGEGFYYDKKNRIALGHRRLSIIDLSPNGKQPMSNEDGTLWIVFNGEIYNYKELRKSLEGKHTFRSNSDTEVILHLYEEKGESLLNDLRGMFAFAIYDSNKNEIFLARDRIGKKPLLYAVHEGKFYFASELRPILFASKISRKINIKALNYIFIRNFKHIPEPYSVIEGIQKVPPASYIKVNKDGISVVKYWVPSFLKEKRDEKEYLLEYGNLLTESSELRMVSDVEVGITLSGGIDSSSILYALSNYKNLKTYTVGRSENDPEILRSRIMAQKYSTIHKELFFKQDSIRLIPHIIYFYGEPFSLFTALHSYAMCEGISKDLKVVITGNGADEVFYGYDGSNNMLAISHLLKISRFVPKSVWAILRSIASKIGNERLEEFFITLQADKNRIKGDLYRNSARKTIKLYSDGARAHVAAHDYGKLLDRCSDECNSQNYIEQSYYCALMLENAHSTTIISDLTGMAHSLEMRSPFLDQFMISFGARLPIQMKVRSVFNRLNNKYIMRKFIEGKLPDEITKGSKMGFGYSISLSELLRNEWKKDAEDILFNRSLFKSDIFSNEFVTKAFNDHISGRKNYSNLLFSLIVFEIWYEMFIEMKTPDEIKFVS